MLVHCQDPNISNLRTRGFTIGRLLRLGLLFGFLARLPGRFLSGLHGFGSCLQIGGGLGCLEATIFIALAIFDCEKKIQNNSLFLLFSSL